MRQGPDRRLRTSQLRPRELYLWQLNGGISTIIPDLSLSPPAQVGRRPEPAPVSGSARPAAAPARIPEEIGPPPFIHPRPVAAFPADIHPRPRRDWDGSTGVVDPAAAAPARASYFPPLRPRTHLQPVWYFQQVLPHNPFWSRKYRARGTRRGAGGAGPAGPGPRRHCCAPSAPAPAPTAPTGPRGPAGPAGRGARGGRRGRRAHPGRGRPGPGRPGGRAETREGVQSLVWRREGGMKVGRLASGVVPGLKAARGQGRAATKAPSGARSAPASFLFSGVKRLARGEAHWRARRPGALARGRRAGVRGRAGAEYPGAESSARVLNRWDSGSGLGVGVQPPSRPGAAVILQKPWAFGCGWLVEGRLSRTETVADTPVCASQWPRPDPAGFRRFCLLPGRAPRAGAGQSPAAAVTAGVRPAHFKSGVTQKHVQGSQITPDS